MNVRFLIVTVAVAAGCGAPPAQGPRGRQPTGLPQPSPEVVARATQDFGTLRDGFLDWYYESHPVRATQLGKHAYDSQLTPMDRASIQKRIQDLLDWDARLEDIPFRVLEDTDRYDYAVLQYEIRDQLLDLEEMRLWTTDPRLYTDVIANGVASLLERPYAPLTERLTALRHRLEQALAVVSAARANLGNPPPEWTQLGITDAEGLIAYLEKLPETIGAEAIAQVQGIEPAREQLVASLKDYLSWLRFDLLPRSTGSYRLGRYLFARKLLYEEHVDLSVEELERLNDREIAAYREQVQKIAEAIAPGRSPREVMDSLARQRPPADSLIPVAREMAGRALAWTLSSGTVSVPDSAAPVVRPSPPYRSGRFAWVNAPGPFDSKRLTTYYDLTDTLPSWSEAERESYLSYFNRGTLRGLTLHETFPGRMIQLGFRRQYPSDLRRVFTPRSLAEGWSQYAEQLAIEDGFEGADSVARLGELRRALEAHARWYATLHLNAMDEPMDSVVKHFMDIAYLEQVPARREVLRATYDPMYLDAALGRVEIEELRKDYKAYLEKQKKTFSARDFYDRLLSLGLPLPLARDVLIPGRPTPRPRAGAARMDRP